MKAYAYAHGFIYGKRRFYIHVYIRPSAYTVVRGVPGRVDVILKKKFVERGKRRRGTNNPTLCVASVVTCLCKTGIVKYVRITSKTARKIVGRRTFTAREKRMVGDVSESSSRRTVSRVTRYRCKLKNLSRRRVLYTISEKYARLK